MNNRSNFFGRFVHRLFDREIEERVMNAVRVLDDTRDRTIRRDTYPRDRYTYDRDEVLRDALEAWRVNPLARRLVELTSQYVVGGGFSVECAHERTHKFIQEWWNHRLNRMDIRVFEWCDELSRSGELFLALSTDAAGMSYCRAIPAADILEIESAENDLEQEITVFEKPRLDGSDQAGTDGLRGRAWPVYNQLEDRRGSSGAFETVMLHYAVNKPVGAKHGESDLAPMLRWLSRYASWLEDRARLNRYRNTFVFWVKAKFMNAEDRLKRQAELNANPPNPGAILVSDDTETWSMLSPNLASFEANEDGLALKKMIAAGSGIPLHFIAEPESATRTTAESAGGPTFRHYEQRQMYFLWMIQDLCQITIRRRKMVDRRVSAIAELKLQGADISARDNAALAIAASTVVGAFLTLRDRGLIDDAELLRLAYRFAGEIVDIEEMMRRGKIAGPVAPPDVTPESAEDKKGDGDRSKRPGLGNDLKPAGVKIDPLSGELKGIDKA